MARRNRQTGWAWIAVACCLSGAAQAQNPAPVMPVYVDDSPAVADLLKNAQHLREQDRLGETAAVYQQIIEQYPFKLLADAPGLYVDALRHVRRTLRADAALLTTYRRLYEPTAAGALASAMSPEPNLVAIEQVVSRFGLCPSGLEAGLRLAGLYLEQASIHSAASVLQEMSDHPDLEAQQARWHWLCGAAGLFGGQEEQAAQHRRALEAMGGDEAQRLEELSRWAAGRTRRFPVATGGGEQPQASAVTEPIGAPLWTQRLASADILAASLRGQIRGRSRGLLPDQPGAHKTLPVCIGDQLLVNDGYSVALLDRHSGRLIWSSPTSAVPRDAQADRLLALQQQGRTVPDQRGVWVTDNRVLAVVGQASRYPMAWNTPQGGTSLVCLDLADGRPLWRVEPGDLDATLTNAFFHGTPVGDDGRVYVMLRRSQASGFQSSYVMALETGTGRLLWRRHLSSTSSTNRYVTSELTQMRLAGGRLFLADPLGAVASLDGRTGAMHWLAVFETRALDPNVAPRNPRLTSDTPPPACPPLLVRAGLIVPSSDVSAPATLLDPDTGRKRRDLNGPGWSDAVYLLPAGEDVLAVGPSPCLFDGRTLAVKWTCELDTQMKAGSHGLAAVTRQHVVVPTKDRLVVIRLSDGTILWQAVLEAPGNVLALDQQLVIAGPQTISSYMSWPQAYERLTRQMRADPKDPQPALALAHVALGARKTEAVLEGVDAALAALDRRLADTRAQDRALTGQPDSLQQDVLRQLLEFVDPSRAAGVYLRRAILDRMARITATPADEVSYHLALADLLTETNNPLEAVDHYQAVLTDQTLSEVLHQTDTGARQAGIEAKIRLRALLEAHGPKMYSRYETLAAQRLAELADQQRRDPDALTLLANQYPLSRAAPLALTIAAESLAQRRQTVEAVSLLRIAYRQTTDKELLARIVGGMTDLLVRTGSTHRAVVWLQSAGRDYPDLQPLRNGQPESIGLWLRDLLSQGAAGSTLPSLSLPLRQVTLLRQRLLTPTHQPRWTWPGDALLVMGQGRLSLLDAQTLSPRWDQPLDNEAVSLLAMSDQQGLLLHQATPGLMAFDNRTGQTLWGPLDLATLLEEVGDRARVLAARPIEQRRFLELMNFGPLPRAPGQQRPDQAENPRPPHLLAVHDQVIVLADSLGRALGIDRDTGQVLWRMICPIEQLQRVLVSDDAAVLLGVSGVNTDAQSVQVVVLDPFTGEPRFPTIEEKDALVWADLSPGMLYFATTTQLSAHRLGNGEVVWRMPLDTDRQVTGGQVGDDSLLLRDASGAAQVIDAEQGRVTGRVIGEVQGPDAAMQAQWTRKRWHLLTPLRCGAVSAEGRELWRDAIDEPVRRLTQLVGERCVVLLGLSQSGQDQAQGQDQVLRRIIQRGNVQANIRIRVGPGEQRVIELVDPQAPQAVVEQPGVEALAVKAGQWLYTLYFLDPDGGSLIQKQQLGPLSEPISPDHALFLNDRVIFSAASGTLVLSPAPIRR